MRFSVIDGAAYSVMLGLGQEYLAAFIFEISGDARATGLITTVPLFLGALLQLISPWGVAKVRSNRRWVVWCASIQAAAFFPMALAAWLGHMPLFLLFLLATLYHAAGLATGAAWTAWIAEIIPPRLRSHWFGKRNRWLQLATLAGVLAGGAVRRVAESLEFALANPSADGYPIGTWIVSALPDSWLEALVGVDLSVHAFAVLFTAAGVMRAISAYYLWRQREFLPMRSLPSPVSFATVKQTFGRDQTGRLIVYMCAMGVAVQAAQPFFNPYVLGGLNVGAAAYTALIAMPYIGRMLVMPAFGRLVARRGLRYTMRFAGLTVLPLPLLWMCAGQYGPTVVVLMLAQLVLGAAMAGYELTTFLMLYESIPEHRRVNAVTISYVGNWLAGTTGSLIGSGVIGALSDERGLILASWAAFGLSVVLRGITLPLLWRASAGAGGLKQSDKDPVLMQEAKT